MHEVGHRLICTPCLHLEEGGLLRLALATPELPLFAFHVLLHFFEVPICSAGVHVGLRDTLPLLLLLVAHQFFGRGGYQFLGSDAGVEDGIF